MNTIKNLHLLEGHIDQDQLTRLEEGAKQYLRLGRVEFKIINFEPGKEMTVRAAQGKNPSGNYLTGKDLIDRARELFGHFFPNYQVHVHPVEFSHAPVEVVDPKWIKDCMLKYSISLKHLVNDTGIDKASLSAVVNGLKPLSQSMKAMFYYYFACAEVAGIFASNGNSDKISVFHDYLDRLNSEFISNKFKAKNDKHKA